MKAYVAGKLNYCKKKTSKASNKEYFAIRIDNVEMWGQINDDTIKIMDFTKGDEVNVEVAITAGRKKDKTVYFGCEVTKVY